MFSLDDKILGVLQPTNKRLVYTPIFPPRCGAKGCKAPAVGSVLQGRGETWLCERHAISAQKDAKSVGILWVETRVDTSGELLDLPCTLGKVPREGDDGFNVVERHRNSAATIIIDPNLLESMRKIDL